VYTACNTIIAHFSVVYDPVLVQTYNLPRTNKCLTVAHYFLYRSIR